MNQLDNFHFSRIAFAVINGKFKFTMFDKRSHKEWLKETEGLTDAEYEKVIRGYMRDNQLVAYRSSRFETVDFSEIPVDSLKHLSILAMVYLNTGKIECYTGARPGKDGEVWEPIKYVGDLNTMLDYRTRLLYAACSS